MAAKAEFDSNVWYSISEARVDNTTAPLRSTLQTTSGGLRVFGWIDSQWQMQPVDDEPGRYLMRYSGTGPGQQLAICHDSEEIAESQSVACMARSSTADNQKWDIVEWGDGTYRMHNAANGTGYALDVHPGSNLFMNNNIEGVNTDVHHVAQHWIWSSVKDINDGAYSTIYSQQSTTTTAKPTDAVSSGSEPAPTQDSQTGGGGNDSSANNNSGGGGLSAGAAAGIGVGVTLAVVGFVLAVLFFWWKKRQAARYSKTSNMDDATDGGHDLQSGPPSRFYPTPPPGTSKGEQTLAQGPGDNGYYGPQEKAMSPSQAAAVQPPQSAGGYNQYPYEMSNQQIHEAPVQWHAELDGYDRRGSGAGMSSLQNTPAVEFASQRHQQAL